MPASEAVVQPRVLNARKQFPELILFPATNDFPLTNCRKNENTKQGITATRLATNNSFVSLHF